MKRNRLLTSLVLGLGLILALGLPLSAGREAQARLRPAGSGVPVTGQLIGNPPEGLSEEAWDKIEAQLPRASSALALTGGAANRVLRSGIDSLIISQIAILTASDAADGDYFGSTLVMSGDTVVIGAWNKAGEGSARGTAYVFERDKGGADNWGQVKILTASDAANDDWFGSSVAISGDTIVVGAPGQDSAGGESGAAYLYGRDKGGPDNWGQVKKLIASDAQPEDRFGLVAIDGDTVVVGAAREDGAGTARGAAYVFYRDKDGADEWGQVKKLTASNPADHAEYGFGLSISGDTLVVGAVFENDRRGAAYVYERNKDGADHWGQVAKLTASDAEDWDFFGGNSALVGDTLVVSAHGEDGESSEGNARGAAYVFDRNKDGADSWGQAKKLTASDAADVDWFGDSVAISGDGNTVVIGAGMKDDAGTKRGAAYVFGRNQGAADNWGQVKKLTASDAADRDFFGGSVAISGDTIIVGAEGQAGEGSNRGAAYVFGQREGFRVYLPMVIANR